MDSEVKSFLIHFIFTLTPQCHKLFSCIVNAVDEKSAREYFYHQIEDPELQVIMHALELDTTTEGCITLC